MDKKMDASVSVSHGGYTLCSYKSNVTLLETINLLCESANEQDKIITKAKIIMRPLSTILTSISESL
jgi:hypothetical protein